MAAIDLTTTAKFKAWASIASASDDTLIGEAITRVSTAVNNYLNRSLNSASYSEVYDGRGGHVLMLRNRPVTAVASLSIDGVAVPLATSRPFNGYTFDSTALYALGSYSFTRDYRNVAVSYTAGYVTIPADIEEAVLEWLNVIYRERDRVGLASKAIGGETTAYDIGAMPKRVTLLLNPFKSVVMP